MKGVKTKIYFNCSKRKRKYLFCAQRPYKTFDLDWLVYPFHLTVIGLFKKCIEITPSG